MATTQINVTGNTAEAQKALNQLIASLNSVGNASVALSKVLGSSLKNVDSSLKNTEITARKTKTALEGLTFSGGQLGTMLGGLVAAFGVRSMFTFIDGVQNMTGRLNTVSATTGEFTQNLEAVGQIALKSGANLAATAELYTRLKAAAGDLGISQNQVIATTYALNMAMKYSGVSTMEAASVLRQFSQTLQKGKVNGDEFVSLVEALGPGIAVIAKNLGLTTAQFREFASKGLLAPKDLIRGIILSLGDFESAAQRSGFTVGQAANNINTAFQLMFIRFDQQTQITQKITGAMMFLFKNMEAVTAAVAVFLAVFAVSKLVAIAVQIAVITKEVRGLAAAAMLLKRTPLGIILSLMAGGAAFAGFKLFADDDEKTAENINDAIAAATAETRDMNQQMSGVGDKFKEIVKDLNDQLTLSRFTRQERESEAKILEINKQLNYAMTDAQKQQVRAIMQQIQANNFRNDLAEQFLSVQNEIAVAYAQNEVQSRTLQAIEQLRKQYGSELANSAKVQLEAMASAAIAAKLIADLERDHNINRKQFNQALKDSLTMSYDQLQVEQKILDIETKSGITLSDTFKTKLRQSELYKQDLGYILDIKKNLESIQAVGESAKAGVVASSQLGQLLPEKKAKADEQTTLNGLKFLYNQGLLEENDYQTARKNAEFEANAAILQARQRMMEQQMAMQGVTNNEIVSMVKDQMAAVAMMQQGGIVGVQGALSAMTNVFDLMKNGNKQSFETYKSLATAQALISTYQAAAMSIAAPPGPPFSYIYVASAILAGMAQVAKIRSMQYSGRAVGGPVVGGQSYLVGEKGPEIFTPGTAGGIVKNSDIMGAGGANVTFNISANDAQGFDQLLINRRGLITQIISDAMADSGKRM